jgi:phenylalanyl-tRNA synthetase alpha chain
VRAPATFPDEPEPEDYVAAALKAIAATEDEDALKAARLEHAGDRSPVALAARSIGELPPTERSPVAQRIATAHARIAAALDERHQQLQRAEVPR